MITWFIGMSGSGKSTLAQSLYKRQKKPTRALVYLDGDDFREIFRNDVDHTIEGRRKNAERISHLCRFFDSQDIHVIAAVLSIFPQMQAWNRENFENYFEIFLDIPLETLKARDTKDLYSAAQAGRLTNVVGMDIPFPRPRQPDLIIDEAMQQEGVDACIMKILSSMPAMD